MRAEIINTILLYFRFEDQSKKQKQSEFDTMDIFYYIDYANRVKSISLICLWFQAFFH